MQLIFSQKPFKFCIPTLKTPQPGMPYWSENPCVIVLTITFFLLIQLQNKPHGIPRSPSGRPLGKPATSRGNVKHFKKKGKKGGKSDLGYDIIVNIDLVSYFSFIPNFVFGHFWRQSYENIT